MTDREGSASEGHAADRGPPRSTVTLPDEVLARRPERSACFETEEGGRFTVLEPKFTGPILGRLLQARLAKPYIRTHLDEVGSLVWEACDGQTDVRALAGRIAERFGPDFDPDGQRLTTFLRAMERRGLIRYR